MIKCILALVSSILRYFNGAQLKSLFAEQVEHCAVHSTVRPQRINAEPMRQNGECDFSESAKIGTEQICSAHRRPDCLGWQNAQIVSSCRREHHSVKNVCQTLFRRLISIHTRHKDAEWSHSDVIKSLRDAEEQGARTHIVCRKYCYTLFLIGSFGRCNALRLTVPPGTREGNLMKFQH